MFRIDNEDDKTSNERVEFARSSWVSVLAFTLVVAVAIVALVVTKSPQAVGLAVSPLLLPLGWLVGRLSGAGTSGGSGP
jgi:hypothetical protein